MIYIDFIKLLFNSIGVQNISIEHENGFMKLQIVAIEFPELTTSTVLSDAIEAYYSSEDQKYKFKSNSLVLESPREPVGIPELILFMKFSEYVVLICKSFVVFNQTKLTINSKPFIEEPNKATEIDGVTCVLWNGKGPSLIINGNVPIEFNSRRYRLSISVNGECKLNKVYFVILLISPVSKEEFSKKIEHCFDFFGIEQTNVDELEALTQNLVDDLSTMSSIEFDKEKLKKSILKHV